MNTMSAQDIRAILRECLPEIREKYGVTSIGVFGSYARGEATQKSDIDIIVELGRARKSSARTVPVVEACGSYHHRRSQRRLNR